MSAPPEVRGASAATIGELLVHLSSRSAQRREDPSAAVPEATLLLASGEWVQGTVLAVTDRADTALVATGGRSYTLVRLDQVSAATVIADPDLAELFGERAPMPVRAPTKLELTRLLGASAKLLSEDLGKTVAVRVRWEDFPVSDRAMTELGAALTALASALRGLAADDLGRSALTGIDAVELGRGVEADAMLDGKLLRIAVVVRGDRIASPSHQTIEAAL